MDTKVAQRNKTRLLKALQKAFGGGVYLTIHDNASTFLSARYTKKRWIIRIHWMFLKAKNLSEVADHIAKFSADRNKISSKFLDNYIEAHWHWVSHRYPPIKTAGKFFDLEKILDRLIRHYFKGKRKPKITWGTSQARKSYEQLQMGAYSTSKNLITIHPKLDQKFVPPYVIEATVFHELCHAYLPVRRKNGRKQIHPPEFKKMEGRYRHLKKAQRWEERFLSRLLKRRQSDKRRSKKRLGRQ